MIEGERKCNGEQGICLEKEHKKDQESVKNLSPFGFSNNDDDDEMVLSTQTKLSPPETVLGLKQSTCYFLLLRGR